MKFIGESDSLYAKDIHQILFGSANSFESYYVHMKSLRTYSQTDRRKFFLTFVRRDFFFSCDYNTFSFYILRM